MNNKKRMVVIADLHCGHEFGLTPPDWWYRDDTEIMHLAKAGRFQRNLCQLYAKADEQLKPINLLVVNGDAIEGKGERSGGVELISADRNEQIQMAKTAIDLADARKVRLLYGTRYHVGKEDDFEAMLANTLKGSAEIGGHAFLDINGCSASYLKFIRKKY